MSGSMDRPAGGSNGRPGSGGSGGSDGSGFGRGRGAMGGGRGFGPGMHMMAGPPPMKAKDFRGSIRRLAGELRPEAARIGLVVALAIIGVFAQVVGPKIMAEATNQLFDGLVGKMLGRYLPAGTSQAQAEQLLRQGGQGQIADMLSGMHVRIGIGVDFDAVGRVLLLLAGVYIVSAVFQWASFYIMAGVSQRTVYRLRGEVDGKLGRLPLRYFDSHPHGDILSRVTNDIDNIANTLGQSLNQIITSVFTILGVLLMMLTISPVLTAISLLVLPTAGIVTAFIARRSQKQFAIQWDRTGNLTGQVEETHTGHALVKVFGHETDAIRRFDAENEELYQASFRAQFVSGVIQPTMNFLSNLNYVAIAVIGGMQVASGRMTLGDVQAFIQYSRQFTMPITQVASIMNVLQSTVASSERVFELLDETEEIPDAASPRPLRDVVGRVVFDDVSFRYEPDAPLIEALSEVAEPGQVVAIVGPTGAGKTTLVNLLMRFYEIDGGRITVDGIDTRDIRRDDLRRTFGMVLQDTWLFGGTIRENIAYGRIGASEEEIVEAARAAHVDHFVRALPQGYDTVIDDEGSSVSQGERQLLTIARAFLADPRILILDEATSSVDTRTEVLVQRAMKRLMAGRTNFVIAHRLSTIRDADVILVMNHGRIVEQGSHEELLAAGGFYAELYNSQFSEAIAEAV
ncbi:MAG TPA: ABC transporter ATP-binding protein [Candidatus Limnocylindrales bacterium]